MNKQNNKSLLILGGMLIILLLAGMACNLGSAQEVVEVIEEVVVIDEPEPEVEEEQEEPEWLPELIFSLDHEHKVDSVAYAHDGESFATGFFMQTNIWDARDAELIGEIETTHSVEALAFLPDDGVIACGLGLGGVNLYAVSDGDKVQDFHGGYDNVLAVSPDGTMVATGNRSGITWLWRVEDGELLAEMDPADYHDDYSEYMTSVAFSPDGRIIAAGHWDGTVFLWDAENHNLINTLNADNDYAKAWHLAFSIDGQHLAVGGARLEWDDVIAIWDLSDGSLVRNLEDFSRGGSRQTPVAYSPDGTLFAAGAVDGIFLWSLPDYELVHILPIEETEDSDWVTDLAFSPDSQFLLAGYWNDYAQLWQVQQ
jgi:WD40 repeat protein